MTQRRRSDGLLALTIVGLVLFGTVMIYSSSVIVGFTKYGDAQYFFRRQIVWALLGLFMLVVAANIDYRFWKQQAKWMLPISILLLLSVFAITNGPVNGAHRWVNIGSLTFQPSEVVKLSFLIYLSAWLAERKERIGDLLGTFLPFLGILTVLSLLMLMQPDFGTLSVMIVSAAAVYYVAGLTWKQAALGLIFVGLGLSVILAVPYRRARLAAFFNPDQDTSGVAYHVKNISIAIGSGGWFGLGFGQSGQKRLFLPEPQNDSIFAVTVEELGFVISSALVLALTLVVYRGYRTASRAADSFGQLLAVGITTWFGYQAFLNLSAMLQIIPLKGVPLPFVSYGGTNLVVSLFAAGVLLSISRYGDDGGKEQGAKTAISKRNRS